MPDIVADTDNGQKLEVYAEVRHACAVNSAVMAPFIGVETFVSPQRLATLRSMASDPHFVVRRAVAANLLELCRQIGPVVQPFLNHLLTDPCPDVTCALVPQIGAVIETLVRLGPHRSPFTDESIIVETCDAVLRCEEQVMNSSSWRLQEDMLCQLSAFPLCLPCNAVHDRLVPRLWHRIDTLVYFNTFCVYILFVYTFLFVLFTASASVPCICCPDFDAVRSKRATTTGKSSSVRGHHDAIGFRSVVPPTDALPPRLSGFIRPPVEEIYSATFFPTFGATGQRSSAQRPSAHGQSFAQATHVSSWPRCRNRKASYSRIGFDGTPFRRDGKGPRRSVRIGQILSLGGRTGKNCPD